VYVDKSGKYYVIPGYCIMGIGSPYIFLEIATAYTYIGDIYCMCVLLMGQTKPTNIIKIVIRVDPEYLSALYGDSRGRIHIENLPCYIMVPLS
jgi:hypothetical protein